MALCKCSNWEVLLWIDLNADVCVDARLLQEVDRTGPHQVGRVHRCCHFHCAFQEGKLHRHPEPKPTMSENLADACRMLSLLFTDWVHRHGCDPQEILQAIGRRDLRRLMLYAPFSLHPLPSLYDANPDL